MQMEISMCCLGSASQQPQHLSDFQAGTLILGCTRPKRGKGKATRSPIAGKYDLDVQVRDIGTYASIGGEVAYA